MKLVVLAPSAQYLASAGNRIRYQRLREPLARFGCSLSIAPIDRIGNGVDVAPGNIVLFSKVQDARSLALAHTLHSAGVHVGIDLFDDYFSQTADARFAPQRIWLEQMARTTSFFLCSTARMEAVAKGYFGNKPGFVLNDPFERFEPARLAASLEARRQKALETRTIDVLWFGMGDNPNFPVGLHDLVHHGHALAAIERQGFAVSLTVLTNLRALDRRGLAMLRRLPVALKLEEWSHEREVELLEANLVSFVPVNAQPFSVAKSLNRAVTAVTGGTQLLTVGYPLYHALDDFCYGDATSLVADLRTGSLRVAPETLDALGKQLNHISNPLNEARALQAFFAALPRPAARPDAPPLAILHGERSTAGIHSFARNNGWLSLASPYTPVGLPFDAHLSVFEPGAAPAVRLTSAVTTHLPATLAALTRKIGAKPVGLAFEISVAQLRPDLAPLIASAASATDTGSRIAMRASVDAATRTIFEAVFGPMQIIDSELESHLGQACELARHSLQAKS